MSIKLPAKSAVILLALAVGLGPRTSPVHAQPAPPPPPATAPAAKAAPDAAPTSKDRGGNKGRQGGPMSLVYHHPEKPEEPIVPEGAEIPDNGG
jgi:hypothetical protein